ncbi:hypothetical protein [Coleofasciculus sp. E1-EBD-02]|uniref:hypothetical protein n=1 Tax=Coleofasciculus sp. E1-EBD-02 TaxID=3068481 RepID=UPI00330251F7
MVRSEGFSPLQLGVKARFLLQTKSYFNPVTPLLAWHTLFDELELRPETVGAQRLAPDSMIKSIPQF